MIRLQIKKKPQRNSRKPNLVLLSLRRKLKISRVRLMPLRRKPRQPEPKPRS
jgi:hypothetical protein